VFLRSGETGLYFAGAGGWIPRRDGCTQFPNPKSAFECATGEGLRDFEVVLSYDSPRYEVVLTSEVLNGRIGRA
jgi:hypothetical protein